MFKHSLVMSYNSSVVQRHPAMRCRPVLHNREKKLRESMLPYGRGGLTGFEQEGRSCWLLDSVGLPTTTSTKGVSGNEYLVGSFKEESEDRRQSRAEQ